MRAVVDDDVDRHDVEAQQCVQLTCTNRSIGLIALISPCPSAHLKMCYRASCCLSTRCAGGDAQPIHGKTGLTAGRAPARQFHDLTFFAGLVAFARGPHPIPFRTRPLNPSAPMVLWLKPRESRSPPGLPKTSYPSLCKHQHERPRASQRGAVRVFGPWQVTLPLTLPLECPRSELDSVGRWSAPRRAPAGG